MMPLIIADKKLTYRLGPEASQHASQHACHARRETVVLLSTHTDTKIEKQKSALHQWSTSAETEKNHSPIHTWHFCFSVAFHNYTGM